MKIYLPVPRLPLNTTKAKPEQGRPKKRAKREPLVQKKDEMSGSRGEDDRNCCCCCCCRFWTRGIFTPPAFLSSACLLETGARLSSSGHGAAEERNIEDARRATRTKDCIFIPKECKNRSLFLCSRKGEDCGQELKLSTSKSFAGPLCSCSPPFFLLQFFLACF